MKAETCPRCGALIGDPQLHARWHAEQDDYDVWAQQFNLARHTDENGPER